jgi:hypothetical protein
MAKKCKICKKRSHLNMKCECGKTYCLQHLSKKVHECHTIQPVPEKKLVSAAHPKLEKL